MSTSDTPFYSNMKSSSLIPVSKATVLAAIPEIIAMVENTRSINRDTSIEKAMKEQRVTIPTPWYRLSKSRPMNRAEAEEWIDQSDEDGWPNSYWRTAGSHWEELAKALEAAALVVEDGANLLLDLEAANLVREYQPRKKKDKE